MSEEFEIQGVHEHEIEHQAHHGVPLAQRVAIFTAIISSFAALISYHSSSQQNEAFLLKNDAVIQQAHASDQWAYYQAKSSKGHLMELASQLLPPDRAKYYQQQLQKYNDQKQQIMIQAQQYETESQAADKQSDFLMSNHHQESQGMLLLQIAISLASVTALTKKRWLFILASIAALGGIIFSFLAWI